MKRLIALALVLTMAISMVPVTAGAENEGTAVSNDVTLEGTSSFGNLLTNTVNESQQEGSGEAYDARICDLVIEGTTATVEYTTPVEANLVVAIYDQDSGKMLGSGTVTVSPEETIAQVEIEIPVMPYYFSAGAYLLDAATNDPVSEEFKTDRYTKVMQDILAATVRDFDPELVLNLDQNDETNFAVFCENTMMAREGEAYNQLTDHGDGTYTIQNPDEKFQAMKVGDTFTYAYLNGDLLIVNVASATLIGSAVFVHENENADLSNSFSFVKIESNSVSGEYAYEYDDSSLADGITVITDEEFASQLSGEQLCPDGVDFSEKGSIGNSFNVELKNIKGQLSFKTDVVLKVYLSFTYQYVELSCEYSNTANLTISASCDDRAELGEYRIPMCLGVFVRIAPSLVVGASGGIAFTITQIGCVAYAYDSNLGRVNDIGYEPYTMSTVELDGTLRLGLELKLGVCAIDDFILEGSVNATPALEFSGTILIPEASSRPTTEVHECKRCCEGTISSVFSVNLELKALGDSVKANYTVLELRHKIANFYQSFTFGDAGMTLCPHKSRLTTIQVLSQSTGAPVPNIPIEISKNGDALTQVWLHDPDHVPFKGPVRDTDENGVTVCFLPDGDYTLTATSLDKAFTQDFTVKNAIKYLEIKVETELPKDTLSLSRQKVDLDWPGSAFQLAATFNELDVTDQCSWSSDNTHAVTVANGRLTPVGAGTAEITAKYDWNGKIQTAVCQVTITAVNMVDQGDCGTTVHWRLDDNGTLTIYGEGKMADYYTANSPWASRDPWDSYAERISAVVVESGVTRIGHGAFISEPNLTSVSIPGTVESIGMYAFSGCISLQQIEIPEGVMNIEQGAFYQCTSLREISIPSSLDSIQGWTFKDCLSLRKVSITDIAKWCQISFGAADANPLYFADNLYLNGQLVTELRIPAEAGTVGTYAFYHYSKLASLVIGDGVQAIGDYAFTSCVNLESADIAASVSAIGISAFHTCSALRDVTLREGLERIYTNAFSQCASLKEISIPDGVTCISANAFYESGLTAVTIPGTVQEIGTSAFSLCTDLYTVTIDSGVQAIWSQAFAQCSNLETVNMPDTITEIKSEAFYQCGQLQEIVVSGNVGEKAFAACTSLSKVVLIDSRVKTIGGFAFNGCESLETITIPDSVTSIGMNAFSKCKTLHSVTLPAGLTILNSGTFSGCENLSFVSIPEGMQKIGANVFQDCKSLSTVEIPVSVTEIGSYAFYNCPLQTVYYGGTEAQWGQIKITNYLGNPLKTATIQFAEDVQEQVDVAEITKPADEATEPTEAVAEPAESLTELPAEEAVEEPLLLEEVADIQWYAAPAGAEMTVEPVLQKLSAFSGTESAKNGVRSVKFTGLEPGEEYVLIVSLIPGSLVPENLLYIDQDNANPDGTLSFTYIPRQDVSARVQLYGVPAGRTVTLDREYLTMEVGSADQKLTAAVTPEEWAGDLTWSAENPENTEVISVNEFGDVTPMAPGTAYAVATVTHGQYVFSARCRVDVTQKRANQEVTGVQLGTTSLTTELLRTDYAAFDVILLLAQNRNPEVTPDTIAPDGGMEDNGVAIESAAFADEKAAAVFDLAVKDDRTLLVVPKASAINNPKPVAGSYTSKVRVTVDGKAFITDTALKLTVKKSMPKLKVSALTFNPFYTGQSQAIQITGATVTDIESKALPEWLTLENGVLTLTEKAPAKASGKVSVTVKTAEWGDNISTNLTIPVKTAYAAPKLKLSATSVTVAAKNSQGISLKLLCGTKTDTLETLNVEDIQVDGFRVKDFDRTDGSFTLIPSGENFAGPHPGTVSFSDTRQTVPLSLKVTAKAPSIAAKPASVTLNSTAGDSARIPITASPADYRIPEVTLFLTDSRGNKLEQQDWLNFWYENGVVTVETVMDKTQPGATYYLHVSTADTRDAVITVKTLAASKSTITASAKISGGIDLSFPASAAVVKPAFKNYASGGFTVTNWDVTEYAGKTAVGSVRDSFTLGKEDGLLVFRAGSKNPPVQGHTYSLTATLTLDNGRSLTLNNLKLPVKRTPVKLKLSKTSLSLNRKIGDTAVVDVTCLTRGYDFTNPVAALIPPNSKDGQSIDLSQPGTQEPLTVSWSDGKLTVTANSTAEAGKTYKIALRATENDPAVTLSVKILDTAVTASMKASGTIDVVRNSTAITVTPAYKNYMGLADISPELTVESGNGKTYKEVDAGLFSIVHNENGTFTITKVPGAEVETALKYRAKLTFKGGANPAYVNLAVKSGTAKVAVSGTPVLYKADRFSRGTFRLTTADKALNPIVKAEIKDAKYQGIFEVYSYGSGEFAIGFKGNKVPDGKLPTSVVLNVYVDGNPAKSVASVALKLQVR